VLRVIIAQEHLPTVKQIKSTTTMERIQHCAEQLPPMSLHVRQERTRCAEISPPPLSATSAQQDTGALVVRIVGVAIVPLAIFVQRDLTPQQRTPALQEPTPAP